MGGVGARTRVQPRLVRDWCAEMVDMADGIDSMLVAKPKSEAELTYGLRHGLREITFGIKRESNRRACPTKPGLRDATANQAEFFCC